jgi:hypothetical protein
MNKAMFATGECLASPFERSMCPAPDETFVLGAGFAIEGNLR